MYITNSLVQTNSMPYNLMLGFAFYASLLVTAVTRGIMFLGCPSIHQPICPSITFLWTRNLRNVLREFPLRLKDELILVVKSHCDLKEHVFGHNSSFHTPIIMTKCHTNVSQVKMMKRWHFTSKRSIWLWHHIVVQKHFPCHYSAP